jgi:DHA2 family lincomycin resistance protein-like MFS transporter
MTTSTTTPPDNRLAPGDGLIIGLLMVSAFVVLLNEMMPGVALPTLITDLAIAPATGQWSPPPTC